MKAGTQGIPALCIQRHPSHESRYCTFWSARFTKSATTGLAKVDCRGCEKHQAERQEPSRLVVGLVGARSVVPRGVTIPTVDVMKWEVRKFFDTHLFNWAKREHRNAEFQKKEKGSITAGKLADIVILSDDIFRIDAVRIKDVKVETTIVGGKIVWGD